MKSARDQVWIDGASALEAALATTVGAGVDDGGVAPGVAEELAGPPHIELNPLRPVTRAERISSMDVLRGLMGILVMNITDFAYGFPNYEIPLSTVKPVFETGLRRPPLEDQYDRLVYALDLC